MSTDAEFRRRIDAGARYLERLLTNDPPTIKLLRTNPFPNAPPKNVRATLYRYRFSSARELRSERIWWRRERIGEFLAPLSLDEASYLSRRFSG